MILHFVMVVMYTALVLLACTPVFMKDIENKDAKTTSADVNQNETSDLEGRPKKDHSYNFEEIGLLNNSTDLLIKNCSNNATNYNCELVFTNCSTHCIKCESEAVCKECEVGFFGQTCNYTCLSNCGAKGCNQHTGKCNGDADMEIHIGASVGGTAVLVIGLVILVKCCCKCRQDDDYEPFGVTNVSDSCNCSCSSCCSCCS